MLPSKLINELALQFIRGYLRGASDFVKGSDLYVEYENIFNNYMSYTKFSKLIKTLIITEEVKKIRRKDGYYYATLNPRFQKS